ncbi:MAG: hypothetical protein AABX11_06905 [Nanoarchaeota archaeon]
MPKAVKRVMESKPASAYEEEDDVEPQFEEEVFDELDALKKD